MIRRLALQVAEAHDHARPLAQQPVLDVAAAELALEVRDVLAVGAPPRLGVHAQVVHVPDREKSNRI